MNQTFSLQNIEDIPALLLKEHSCFAIYGDMGVGKTTLIKKLLLEIGVTDAGHSPTFGLVNEYQDAHGNPLAYHYDFYRLTNLEEALDLGLEDYFMQDVYHFIEWPERISELLPPQFLPVHLYFVDETTRRIEY